MDQQEEKCMCEATGCSLPGTICPACEQCFCFQHLQRSSCEACRQIVSHRSFEHQLGRLVSIGFSVLLCGLLFLLLPHDSNGIIIQLAITLLVVGTMLLWFGLLART
jgi:hypothetical protein